MLRNLKMKYGKKNMKTILECGITSRKSISERIRMGVCEMKITLDREADAAYIYFKEISLGEVVKTISLNDSINVDLDSDGRALGIEILDASKNLPAGAVKGAEVIG